MSEKRRKEVFAMFSGSYDMAYKIRNIYQDITFPCSFPVDLPMEYWKHNSVKKTVRRGFYYSDKTFLLVVAKIKAI